MERIEVYYGEYVSYFQITVSPFCFRKRFPDLLASPLFLVSLKEEKHVITVTQSADEGTELAVNAFV